MNGWERWAKRFLKGIIWVVALIAAAIALDVKLTWQTLLLIAGASFVDSLLDSIWPTDASPARQSPQGSEEANG